MAKTVSRKALAMIMAALLTCTLGLLALTPQSAHAAQASNTPLTTQAAAKESIYVRSSIGDKKYTYNKYGLVTKITDTNSQWKLTYKGTKLVKVVHALKSTATNTWRDDIEYTIAYDSKNRAKSMTVVSEGMPVNLYNNTETYTYNKKNQVTKKVTTYKDGTPKSTVKYSYNAKGLVSKIVSSISTEALKYDAKGNKISYSCKYAANTYRVDLLSTFKNTYKSGRLTKVTQVDGNYEFSKVIKYTKKSVPKKYAAAVKAQQTALRGFTPGVFISQL